VFLTFPLVALNIKQIFDFLKAKAIEDRRAAENRPPRNRPFFGAETASSSTSTWARFRVEWRTWGVCQERAKARREKAAKRTLDEIDPADDGFPIGDDLP
jgi:hypothetical protein